MTDGLDKKTKENWCWPTYLAGLFDEGDVGFDPQRPVDMDSVFVELEQEDNNDKDSIHHDEGEDCYIPKFL